MSSQYQLNLLYVKTIIHFLIAFLIGLYSFRFKQIVQWPFVQWVFFLFSIRKIFSSIFSTTPFPLHKHHNKLSLSLSLLFPLPNTKNPFKYIFPLPCFNWLTYVKTTFSHNLPHSSMLSTNLT